MWRGKAFCLSILLLCFNIPIPLSAQNVERLVDDLSSANICRKQKTLLLETQLGEASCSIAGLFSVALSEDPSKKYPRCLKTTKLCMKQLKSVFEDGNCIRKMEIKREKFKRKSQSFCPISVASLDLCFQKAAELVADFTKEMACSGQLPTDRTLPGLPEEDTEEIESIVECEEYEAKCHGLAGRQ